ncbi:hypothetical protein ABW20_dc0102147 [Dactylellina cionopaga]|nr:hypothetical protein ABW20_dc0102147 [Dactylellina cionopaga]
MESAVLAPPDHISTTVTTTEQRSDNTETSVIHGDGILRLRGTQTERRRVTWTNEVVDNEGLGRKKTKICCIYHKTRDFGESSSEESDSSSSSDDEQESDKGSNPEREPGSPSQSSHQNHICQRHMENRRRRKNAYEEQPNQQKKTP